MRERTDRSGPWEELRHWELDDFYRRIRAKVMQLEEEFAAGTLADFLETSDVASVVGRRILDVYEKLASERRGPLDHLRLAAVRSLLAQLREDIFAVRRVAQAQVSERTARPGRILRLQSSFPDSAPVEMRVDQALAVRFWGIGFDFEDVETTDEFGRMVARSSVGSASTCSAFRRC